jgi:hypothetical protein
MNPRVHVGLAKVCGASIRRVESTLRRPSPVLRSSCDAKAPALFFAPGSKHCAKRWAKIKSGKSLQFAAIPHSECNEALQV